MSPGRAAVEPVGPRVPRPTLCRVSRTPRSRRTDPESRLLTTIRVGGTGLLVTGLLAGCGSPGASAPALPGGLSPVPAATQSGSTQVRSIKR